MSSQLDILALEPFFGGVRRMMLETVIRVSRHRWTLLKLPPRRIERRLAASAAWFAEQLSRHWVGRVDLIFTSDAFNLSEFFRLMPQLARKPSVVYFHSNQLPEIGATAEETWQVVNLATAGAAEEAWFNSQYHMRSFLERAAALVKRHPEMSGRSPVAHLTSHSRLMHPPVDLGPLHEIANSPDKPRRETKTIFVETRDADVKLLNAALSILTHRAEKFRLVTIGPVESLAEDLPRVTISETDEQGQARALLGAGVFISAKPGAAFDHHAVRALHAGCWPVMPMSGVYPELLPRELHASCLYELAAGKFGSRIQDAWHLVHPTGYEPALHAILRPYDAIAACKAMDQRFEELAAARGAGSHASGASHKS